MKLVHPSITDPFRSAYLAAEKRAKDLKKFVPDAMVTGAGAPPKTRVRDLDEAMLVFWLLRNQGVPVEIRNGEVGLPAQA
jgi:hypothetical protein